MPTNHYLFIHNTIAICLALFLGCILGASGSSACAQASGYSRHTFRHGIAIDIPSDWVLLDVAVREALNEKGDSIVRQTGIEENLYKETLIAANSSPSPVGAMARISINNPVAVTQEELELFEPGVMPMLAEVFLKQAKAAEAHGGIRIIQLVKTEIVDWNGKKAIHFRYTREGMDGTSTWVVDQYRIPMTYGMIEAMFSQRQASEVEWKRTITTIIDSVKF